MMGHQRGHHSTGMLGLTCHLWLIHLWLTVKMCVSMPAQSDRDQLRDIASAMQRQIELLTRAVEDLKEVREAPCRYPSILLPRALPAIGRNLTQTSSCSWLPPFRLLPL